MFNADAMQPSRLLKHSYCKKDKEQEFLASEALLEPKRVRISVCYLRIIRLCLIGHIFIITGFLNFACARKGVVDPEVITAVDNMTFEAKPSSLHVKLPTLQDLNLSDEDSARPLYYEITIRDFWKNCQVETKTLTGLYEPGLRVLLEDVRPCKYLVNISLSTSQVFSLSYDGIDIDYERDVKPILDTYCVFCHHPNSGLTTESLNDYKSVYVRRYSIKNFIVNGSMPPPTKMTMYPDDISLISAWVDQGAGFPNGDSVSQPAQLSEDKDKPSQWLSSQVFIDDEEFTGRDPIVVRGNFRKVQ